MLLTDRMLGEFRFKVFPALKSLYLSELNRGDRVHPAALSCVLTRDSHMRTQMGQHRAEVPFPFPT